MEATPDVAAPEGQPVPGRFERGTVEFDRVVNFSDAIYAIALTLLVVSIEVPQIPRSASRQDLLRAIDDLQPQIVTFFTSFVVIGSFWLAHHRFVDRLACIDRRFVQLNLLYLAFVAFVPFPAGVLGEHADNAVAVIVYAITLAILSSFETALFWLAWRHRLMRGVMTTPALRYNLVASLIPVGMFLLSIPVALVKPLLGILTWFVSFPLEALLDRFKPPDANEALA